MTDHMNVVEWKAGETVFEEGEISESVYLILRGQISLTGKLNGRGRNKLIAKLGSGEVLGEAAFFQDHIHNLNATASEDTEAIVIHETEARELFYNCPAIIRKTIISLYERLHDAYIFPSDQSGELVKAAEKSVNSLEVNLDQNNDQMILFCDDVALDHQMPGEVVVRNIPFTVSNSYQKLETAKYTNNSLRVFSPRCSDFSIPHFEITARNDSFWVRDLGSPHGTIVNGKKIHRFGQEAYAPLEIGTNTVVAGTKEHNVTFKIQVPKLDVVRHFV